MISAQPNKRTQETLIERLMELPNSAVSFFNPFFWQGRADQ
jgi:hypothetical protein